MNSELISIIIPVFNHANRLRESLLSIASQTHKNVEVIIVNDGSTDKFEEEFLIIKTIHELSKLKLLLINQVNQGAPAARNRGFRESNGEYIIFWDADTIAKPWMLEKMLNTLKANPEASYAYSQFRFGIKKIGSQPFDKDKIKINNYIDTTSLIRRADVIPFDESLKRFQDWDLWLSMLEKNRVGVYIPIILYTKRTFGRKGMSGWLPEFVYRLPVKIRPVRNFEAARSAVLLKHGLPLETKV